jgi:hypothetical protein
VLNSEQDVLEAYEALGHARQCAPSLKPTNCIDVSIEVSLIMSNSLSLIFTNINVSAGFWSLGIPSCHAQEREAGQASRGKEGEGKED